VAALLRIAGHERVLEHVLFVVHHDPGLKVTLLGEKVDVLAICEGEHGSDGR
jgi:hypothetical protein